MNMRMVAAGIVGLAAAGVLAGAAYQPAKDKDKPKGPAQPADKAAAPGQPGADDPMMAAMMAAANPGPAHAVLNAFEGEWHATVSSWMAPGTDANVSEGKMKTRWVLGGRWLHQDYKGDFNGMPFDGVGTFGYDNVKKEYIGTWTDSFSTGLMVTKGSYDAATKAFTLHGEFPDPMTGKDVKARNVFKIVSPTEHAMEMYCPGEDGKEFLTMKIVYKRPGKSEGAPDNSDDKAKPKR